MAVLLLKSNKLLPPVAQEMGEEFLFIHTYLSSYYMMQSQLYC